MWRNSCKLMNDERETKQRTSVDLRKHEITFNCHSCALFWVVMEIVFVYLSFVDPLSVCYGIKNKIVWWVLTVTDCLCFCLGSGHVVGFHLEAWGFEPIGASVRDFCTRDSFSLLEKGMKITSPAFLWKLWFLNAKCQWWFDILRSHYLKVPKGQSHTTMRLPLISKLSVYVV